MELCGDSLCSLQVEQVFGHFMPPLQVLQTSDKDRLGMASLSTHLDLPLFPSSHNVPFSQPNSGLFKAGIYQLHLGSFLKMPDLLAWSMLLPEDLKFTFPYPSHPFAPIQHHNSSTQ